MSIVVYEIKPEGELVQLPSFSKDVLSSDKVVIVVAERQRKIYLWKGKRSSVKKKFVGARKASDLRAEWGLTFKVVAMDEGEEDNEFLALLGAKVEAPRKPSPIEVTVEEGRAVAFYEEVSVEKVQPKVSVEKPQPVAQPPQTQSLSPPASSLTVQVPQVKTTVHKTKRVEDEAVGINEDQVLSKLNSIDVPNGYVREIVIIGPCIYAVREIKTSIFGKESVERRLEKVNPPEGVFVVENFLPRVISEGGKIVAVEFLRERSKGEGVEHLKSEMVKHLEDIISAFRSK